MLLSPGCALEWVYTRQNPLLSSWVSVGWPNVPTEGMENCRTMSDVVAAMQLGRAASDQRSPDQRDPQSSDAPAAETLVPCEDWVRMQFQPRRPKSNIAAMQLGGAASDQRSPDQRDPRSSDAPAAETASYAPSNACDEATSERPSDRSQGNPIERTHPRIPTPTGVT